MIQNIPVFNILFYFQLDDKTHKYLTKNVEATKKIENRLHYLDNAYMSIETLDYVAKIH